MLWFSAPWLLLVYVPVSHWVWGGGWLGKLGVLDFAGGIVVHVNAGMAALVAALVLGKRRGFPTVAMPPHSLPLTVLGAGMLWVGWFGFNASSALAANTSAGMAMLVKHLGAAMGALVVHDADDEQYRDQGGAVPGSRATREDYRSLDRGLSQLEVPGKAAVAAVDCVDCSAC